MKVSFILVNAIAVCSVSAFSLPSSGRIVKLALRSFTKADAPTTPTQAPTGGKDEIPKTLDEFKAKWDANLKDSAILVDAIIGNAEFAKYAYNDIEKKGEKLVEDYFKSSKKE